jgi:hypothetical protein
MKSVDAPLWTDAIKSELASITENEVFELVPRSAAKHILGTRWVFVKKPRPGQDPLYKGRLVVRGFQQRPGIDYYDVFAPVVTYKSIRLIIAIAAQYGMFLHSMDVKTAFLHGTLEEDIFIEIPEGLPGDRSQHVVKLKRSLYGLKQAPRAWNNRLNTFLCSKLGFYCCDCDPGVYWLNGDPGFCILTTYVDDLLIAATSMALLQKVKDSLSAEFSMKDLGQCSSILSIDITQSSKGIAINQLTAIQNLLVKFGMESSNASDVPISASTRLGEVEPHMGKADPSEYRSLVGSLQYLALVSRPDIALATSSLASFNQEPLAKHMTAAKKVLKYLKGTAELSIHYLKGEQLTLTGYTDASFGLYSKESMTLGYVFVVNGGAITWKSTKKPLSSPPQSTVEAESTALTSGVREMIWLLDLLCELRLSVPQPTVFSDSEGTLSNMRTGAVTEANKHFKSTLKLPHYAFKSGVCRLEYISTCEQPADFLTKQLPVKSFVAHREAIGMK